MKRLFVLLTLLIASFAGASNIPLTGTILGPDNQPFNGSITFSLTTVAREISTNKIILPTTVTYTVTNGTIQSGATLKGVDDMDPANVAYVADFIARDNFNGLIAEYYVAPTGASFDLGTATFTPITISNIAYRDLFNIRSMTMASGSSISAVSGTYTIIGANIDANTNPMSHLLQSTGTSSPGGDVALVANATTTITTKAVTMPSSGGPFRALVSHTDNITQTNTGTVACWVNDGTNTFAGSQVALSAGNVGGIAGFQVSPTTYNNSAVVTFTLICRSNATSAINLASGITGGQNTTVSVSVISAN
jgi:hypothetical protein